MGTGELYAEGNPAMDYRPIQEGKEILLVASCYRNRNKLQSDEPLGSYADFTFFYLFIQIKIKLQPTLTAYSVHVG